MAMALATEDEETEEKGPGWRPANADWTSLHELLAGIWDRLGALAALTADLPIGVKHRHEHPAPYPRPETELDRQRKARAAAREQAYDDRLLGAVEAAKRRWRAAHPDAAPPRRGG